MFAHTLSQKDALGHHVYSQCSCPPAESVFLTEFQKITHEGGRARENLPGLIKNLALPGALVDGEGTGGVRTFDFYGNFDKGDGGAAESFVLAEDQGQVAANGGFGDGNGGQNTGFHVFEHARAGDEAHAYIGGDKALEQFAGVE